MTNEDNERLDIIFEIQGVIDKHVKGLLDHEEMNSFLLATDLYDTGYRKQEKRENEN